MLQIDHVLLRSFQDKIRKFSMHVSFVPQFLKEYNENSTKYKSLS